METGRPRASGRHSRRQRQGIRSRALQRGAEEYGVSLIHRPVATPHYGGHIERLIGTMMGAVHLLPGTTFSDIESRGDYDSLANSAMTLDELERWLALEILRYHASSPRRAWDSAERGLARSGRAAPSPIASAL